MFAHLLLLLADTAPAGGGSPPPGGGDPFGGMGMLCVCGVLPLLATVFWLWMLIDALVNEPTTNDKLLWFLVIFFLHFLGVPVIRITYSWRPGGHASAAGGQYARPPVVGGASGALAGVEATPLPARPGTAGAQADALLLQGLALVHVPPGRQLLAEQPPPPVPRDPAPFAHRRIAPQRLPLAARAQARAAPPRPERENDEVHAHKPTSPPTMGPSRPTTTRAGER
jgi:hypothetical protein